jgi:hypothetical protein
MNKLVRWMKAESNTIGWYGRTLSLQSTEEEEEKIL